VFAAVLIIGIATGYAGALIGLTGQTGLITSVVAQAPAIETATAATALAWIGAGFSVASGLIATDFTPTTSVTAKMPGLIPESTTYQLDPLANMSGDAKEIANRTLDQWIKPEVQSTPGGVSVFVSKIDFRRAALCGSASKATDACTENPSSAVVNIPMGDSRFKSVFEEMFSNPTKDLMKYKYPYQGR